MKLKPALQELYNTAKKARENAYSPYSRHKVGAAVRLENGQIFSGCNVENSSYGATVCAERVAIQSAIATTGPKIKITDVMVVTDATPPWPPCGMCRQVIAEFAGNTQIHAANLSESVQTMSFTEILPHAFTPEHLIDSK